MVHYLWTLQKFIFGHIGPSNDVTAPGEATQISRRKTISVKFGTAATRWPLSSLPYVDFSWRKYRISYILHTSCLALLLDQKYKTLKMLKTVICCCCCCQRRIWSFLENVFNWKQNIICLSSQVNKRIMSKRITMGASHMQTLMQWGHFQFEHFVQQFVLHFMILYIISKYVLLQLWQINIY